ncbi:MAG TPA: hypothetical protein VN706_16695 [Gemmatimonadaceae bacterium]|nr:hypothetical protein [Gemmatimonadaceae bacterium]
MRSRFTLVTPPEPAEPVYYDARYEMELAQEEAALRDQLPGGGRIRLVAGYFSVIGWLMLAGLGFSSIAMLMTLVDHWRELRIWEGYAMLGLTSWASLYTARLLRQRRRAGGFTAMLGFTATLASVGHGLSTASIVTSAVGLCLTASVWKHLE